MSRDDVARHTVRLRGRRRRTLGEQLMVRVPVIVRLGGRAFQRLPVRSRRRGVLLEQRMRQIYEAFNRGDMEVFLLLGNLPSIEYHTGKDEAGVPFGGDLEDVYYGYDGLVALREQWIEAWEGYRVEPEEVIDCGDKIIVFLRHRGRGRGSGLEIDQPWAHVVHLEEGRGARIDTFWDRAKALEAMGIRE